MKNYTETALEAIADALHTGADDVAMVLTVIITVVLLLVVIASAVRIKNRARIRKSSEISYQKLIRKHNLTILELDMLEELAGTLKDPDKKYKLLVDSGAFRRAVHKLDDLPKEKLRLLSSLQEKTGLASGAENTDYLSTKSFSRGKRVFLVTASEEIYEAEVYSVSEADIMLKTDESVHFDAGEQLSLFSFTASGIIIYELKVEKSRSGVISALHARECGPEKRNVKLPIVVSMSPGEEKQASYDSELLQLTGTNAVIRDRGVSLKVGEELRLSPRWGSADAEKIDAVVKKISREKEIALISFLSPEHIKH